MSTSDVLVTGVGLALPGVDGPADLLRTGPTGGEPQVDPAARLGKRGLRYKDRASQLALCAAADGLRAAGLLTDALTVPGTTVGVVASSNLGNLDTVCEVADGIKETGVDGISPMGLPNASSNVIASTVAIRYGLRGPNLMVCNGATSGLDAVHWAASSLAAGRAERFVVIGVETDNRYVRGLLGDPAGQLLDGAVALVWSGPTRPPHAGPPAAPCSAGTPGRAGSTSAWSGWYPKGARRRATGSYRKATAPAAGSPGTYPGRTSARCSAAPPARWACSRSRRPSAGSAPVSRTPAAGRW